MKRFILIILISFLFTLTGCGQDEPEKTDSLKIVCTVFPQYDWTSRILGDGAENAELTLLLDTGVDLHNYQPTVGDIVKISACDLFIYIGGESDKWVNDALAEAVNPNMVTLNLLSLLGNEAKTEEIIPGMQTDHDHGEDEDHDHGDNESEYDEHVWLSLKNAGIFCRAITDALSTLDADNAGLYEANLAAYSEELAALDSEYKTAVDTAPHSTLMFCDRFPLRYLVDDYGLSYYAAFPGCSAETEASFDTIVFLAGKTDELGLHSILVTETADLSIAEAIIASTTAKNAQVLVFNSMQSVTAEDIQNEIGYLSIMKDNLAALKKALGG